MKTIYITIINFKSINRVIYTFWLILFLVIGINSAEAQSIFQWSAPQKIPNYQLTSRAPLMVSDQNRTIHAFNFEQTTPKYSAIMYRKWTPEQGWSPPTDIIIPPFGAGQQTVQGVYLDKKGYLHLIFANSPESGGSLYYSKALASIADKSNSWSIPMVIGQKLGPLAFAALTGRNENELIAFYVSEMGGSGLYEIHSLDEGESWSSPRPVALNNAKDQWPASIRTAVDDNGNIHVVWGNVNSAGTGDEVRYARIDSNFNIIENSIVLAKRDENDYSTTWPSIVTKGSMVMVVYQDGFPATRWMQISMDGGTTWSQPSRPFTEIGEYENAVLLKDSSDTIYMIMGNRTANPEIHGMWYTRWLGRNWTPLLPITSGPSTPSYDPSAPQAVILQGNLIMATWWHNVRNDKLSGAWYSYTFLDSPPISVSTLPLPTPFPTSTPTMVVTSTLISPQTDLIFNNNLQQTTQNPGIPILIAILPVLVLVPIIIILRRKR